MFFFRAACTPTLWRPGTFRLHRGLHIASESSTEKSHEDLTTFGYERVSEAEKAKRVHETFSSVAQNYDVMNDVMSFGIHRVWKDYFVQQLDLTGNAKVLDVAGGTGDIAFRLKTYSNHLTCMKQDYQITVLDINNDMLNVGKSKLRANDIVWVHGDAMQLPFPDNYFDVYTVVFGIRNFANYQKALNEATRVLVPGGRFICMEFTTLVNPLFKRLYDIYSFELIPIFGELIAQDRKAYTYLVESIRRFPKQDEFAQLMKASGLCHINYENLFGSIVAIHSGFKPITDRKG